MNYFYNNKKLILNDNDILGSGGEKTVYRYKDLAAAIFYENDESLSKLNELQTKITKIPDLPSQYLKPLYPYILKDNDFIIGYMMKLGQGKKLVRMLREDESTWDDRKIWLKTLLKAIKASHQKGFINGDVIKPANILCLDNGDIEIVDVESGQFDQYLCRLFTERFVDPTLLDNNFQMVKAYTKFSDYYAWLQIFVKAWVGYYPFQGIYKTLQEDERIQRRISILNKEVELPSNAGDIHKLPNNLLSLLEDFLHKDQRYEFDFELFNNLQAPHLTIKSSVVISKYLLGNLVKLNRPKYVFTNKNQFRYNNTTITTGVYEGFPIIAIDKNGEIYYTDGVSNTLYRTDKFSPKTIIGLGVSATRSEIRWVTDYGVGYTIIGNRLSFFTFTEKKSSKKNLPIDIIADSINEIDIKADTSGKVLILIEFTYRGNKKNTKLWLDNAELKERSN